LLASCACGTLLCTRVDAGQPDEDPTPLKVFVETNCLDCHSGQSAEAGMRLDNLKATLSDHESFRSWSAVFSRVSKGEMPPKDYTQPAEKEKSKWLSTLEDALSQADEERHQRFGRSPLRRLSRAEYANSLRENLALPHLELDEMLPPDGLSHGFPKSADALDFSHVMISRYFEAADIALWKALAPRAKGQECEVIRSELSSVDGTKDTLQTLHVQLKHTSAMPLVGTERDPTLEVHPGNFQKREPGYVRDPEPKFDGVATFMHSRANHNVVLKPFKVKQSGYYKLRVHGWGLVNDHGKLIPSDRTETVAFYTPSGRLLGRCDLPPNEPTTSEVKVWLNEDERIEYLAVSAPNEWFKLPRKLDPKYEQFKARGIGLQWFEMEGPLDESWPPESHRRLLGEMKLKPIDRQPNGLQYQVVTDDPQADAERLLRSFAERAYRRPLEESDLAIPMRLVRQRLERDEPFVDALMAGYRAVLTSPKFLLLQEQAGELDPWALASRLSFFLWNSPPDDELRKVAASGELATDEELRRQSERMLGDPKADRFVEHFLDYWLDLRNIRLTEPDENLYPEHNALLTESMVEETRGYFDEMIRSNLGAWHIIDSDFLMINQRLAELYSEMGKGEQGTMADVHGSDIRKVSIPANSLRGGLLTQASLLKITANGTTTSPVVRGTFTLTKLLGDPPPPPPPSVPAIEPDISGSTTIRDQLARHRADPACASCHEKIDPPGFALESFDVMGGLRDRYRATLARGENGIDKKFNAKPVNYKLGLKVDSAGELSSGEPFTDVNDFRQRLKPLEPQIARNLLNQLIVYATGAPTGFADEAVVDEMLLRLEPKNYGVRSMIHEIIQSDLFRKK